MLALAAQESTERSAGWNAGWKCGVGLAVGLQFRNAAHPGVGAARSASGDLGVAFELKSGMSELAAGVEGGARRDRLAGHLAAHLLERGHDGPQPGVGEARRGVHVQPGARVHAFALW